MDTTWGVGTSPSQIDTVVVTDQSAMSSSVRGTEGRPQGSIVSSIPPPPSDAAAAFAPLMRPAMPRRSAIMPRTRNGLLALAAISRSTKPEMRRPSCRQTPYPLARRMSLRRCCGKFAEALSDRSPTSPSLQARSDPAILVQDANNRRSPISWISERPGAERRLRADQRQISPWASSAPLPRWAADRRWPSRCASPPASNSVSPGRRSRQEKTAEMARVLGRAKGRLRLYRSRQPRRGRLRQQFRSRLRARSSICAGAIVGAPKPDALEGAGTARRCSGRSRTFHELNYACGASACRRPPLLEERLRWTCRSPSPCCRRSTNGSDVEKLAVRLLSLISPRSASPCRRHVGGAAAQAHAAPDRRSEVRNIGLMSTSTCSRRQPFPLSPPASSTAMRLARDIVVNLDSDAACRARRATMGHAVTRADRRCRSSRVAKWRHGCCGWAAAIPGNLIAEPVSIGHLVQLSLIPPKRKAIDAVAAASRNSIVVRVVANPSLSLQADNRASILGSANSPPCRSPCRWQKPSFPCRDCAHRRSRRRR